MADPRGRGRGGDDLTGGIGRGRWTRLVVALLAPLIAAGALPILAPTPAAAAFGSRPIPGPLLVRITDEGFVPQVASIVAGQTVHVDNETDRPQTYTAVDGWIDSGPILPGGRFVFAPSAGTTGSHAVSSTTEAELTGTVSVGLLDLPDNGSTNLVSATTLTTWAPTTNAGDVHPRWGVVASRNRALVTFANLATITQAGNAFATAGVNVVGAKRELRLVVVEVPDSGVRGDFEALDTAVATLRTMPGVVNVSYDFAVAPEATAPRPADPDPGAAPGGTAPGVDYAWTWEDTRTATGAPSGTGGNSGMEASNVPAAWNLADHVLSLSPVYRPDVAVLDSFSTHDHPDAPHQALDVCDGTPSGCSRPLSADSWHGSAVVSVIGAPFDRDSEVPGRSTGMQGVNPAVDVTGIMVPYATSDVDVVDNSVFMVDYIGILDGILRARSSSMQRLRVLNLSQSGIVFARTGADTWAELFQGKLCGPGFADDATGTEPCTPNNEDSYNREIAAAAEAHRGIAAEYARLDVLMVVAAGNGSALANAACLPYGSPTCTPVEVRSDAVVPLVRLEKIWGSGTPSILSVSSYNTVVDPGVPTRDDYSNVGGTVSAPGLNNLGAKADEPTPAYGKFAGTSAAAAFVSGLASYLHGLRAPTHLSYSETRRIIVGTARDDVADGGPPRIDAYAAVMNLTGSTVRMVDVNDPSAEGNQRVVYDEDGTPLGENDRIAADGRRGTAPDSRVDIRDLRRYRDAYLRTCQLDGADAATGCPAAEDIHLDGEAATNRHFDLNLDGCVSGCGNDDFSRFDFNGDGKLSNDTAAVPISATTGAPTNPPTMSQLTDLDVLESVWGSGSGAETQGWTKQTVGALLHSADVQVNTADLFDLGATKVTVQGFGGADGAETPEVVLTQTPAHPLVISVPVDPASSPAPGGVIRALVTTEWNDGSTSQWISTALPARVGEDISLRPCSNLLTLVADRPVVRAGDTGVEITAQVESCFGPGNLVDVESLPVTFTVEGTTAGELYDADTETDHAGKARVSYDTDEDYEGDLVVVATVMVGDHPISASIPLGVAKAPTVWYRWRQTNLEYERGATNDKGGVGDDCRADLAATGSAHCFRSTQHFDFEDVYAGRTYGVERSGRIDPGPIGSSVPLVTEWGRFFNRLDGSSGDLDLLVNGQRATDRPDPYAVGHAVRHSMTGSPVEVAGETWSHPYVDEPVDGLSVTYGTDGLVLDNLAAIGDELYYPVAFSSTALPGSELFLEMDMPAMASRAPSELLLTRREDRSSFQFSDDLDTSISLRRFEDGTYDTYEWCGVLSKDFASIPEGYYSDADPWLWGLRPSEVRSATRGPLSRYAPTYTGTWKARFELVMAVTDGSEPDPEDIEFGGCTETEPTETIQVAPEPVLEGDDVTMWVSDTAVLPELTHHWRLGDGEESDAIDVSHSYADDGTYPVGVTRSSMGQVHNELSRDVVVENVAPSIEDLEDVVGQTEPTLRFQVVEPGPVDAQALTVNVTSTTPGFVAPAPRQSPAGLVEYPLGEQPPGLYTVKVTVTDKDGAGHTATAQVWVPPAESEGQPGQRIGSASPPPRTAAVAGPVGLSDRAARSGVAGGRSGVGSEPVVAYTIDAGSTATGAPLTVRNRSRAGGVAVPATLTAGDGRVAAAVEADGTVAVSYLDAGSFDLAMEAGAPPTTAASPVTVTGESLVPNLTYGPGGATSGDQGALVVVRARLMTPGGAGVGGRTTHFTLGTSAASAVTGADGFATASIAVPSTPGAATLQVVVPAAGPSPQRSLSVPFTIAANSAPVALTGGPYEVGLEGELVLDASSSSDPDPGQTATLQYAWDLDGNADFAPGPGLRTGSRPAPVGWDDVQAVVCGGTCDLGDTHEIALRVTDSSGAAAVATTQVSVLREFGLSVTPGTATLVPGSSHSFTVSVFSNSGFTSPVTLSAGSLPTGMTASFSPKTLPPGGTSILTLSASPTAGDLDFPLVVTGTGGGLTRQAGGSIDVEFGLIPTCTGRAAGKVINARTGAPIVGVNVLGGVTDDAGEFLTSPQTLGPGNSPRGVSTTFNVPGHHSRTVGLLVACGTTPYTTVALDPIDTVRVSGTVRTAEAPHAPIADARVGRPSSQDSVTDASDAGADGTYSRNYTFPAGSAEATVSFAAVAPQRHRDSEAVTLRAGEDVTGVDFHLEQRCYSRFHVRAIDKDTRKPIPAARISFAGVTGSFTTGPDGRVLGPEISLDPIRAPRGVQVQARLPVGNQVFYKNSTLSSCGIVVPVDVELVVPPASSQATLDVLVVDDDTGDPVPAADVRVRYTSGGSDLGFPITGPDGHSVKTLNIGAGATSRTVSSISAYKGGYLWKSTTPIPVTLTKDETSTVTVRLQSKRYGVVEGTVRDSVSGLPVAGVRPRVDNVAAVAPTGADGRYRVEGIELGLDGEASRVNAYLEDPSGRYWTYSGPNFDVGIAPVTHDIDLVPVCTGATIRGRIVDATTRLPIPTARASVQNVGSDDADDDGRFVIRDVPVMAGNRPRAHTVTASAPGYQSASKIVTVFCGADIVVDFGTDQDGTGSIVGTVTDDATDLPVADAFVGTEFGGSDTTDAEGRYEINQAPAGAGGGPRDWAVTVVPPEGSGLGEATKVGTVRRDETTTVDFALGEHVEPPADNVAPVAVLNASPGPSVAEGSTVTVSASGSHDPDASPDGLTYEWDLDGDGQFDDASAVTATVARPDDAVVVVGVRVTDSGTQPGPLSDTATTELTFTNAAPTVTPVAAASTTHSRRVDISATFSDPGTSDTHTATVDWGDGTPVEVVVPTPGAPGTGTIAATRTYSSTGERTIEVCITDDDGGRGCEATTVEVVGVLPGPPVDVSAVGGDAQARVRWKPPVSDGGSPLIEYRVETTPGGGVVTAPAAELTRVVSPLANGTDHTFRVAARNEYGWGPWSEPSNVTRPRPSCTGSRFNDVAADHPFCPEITWMGEKGISTGYQDGTYKPTSPITRQAMAAFSYRLLNPGAPALPACTAKPFTDVAETDTFCPEITWMRDQGISTGYEDGTYKPTAVISRQAMAAFLYRLDGSSLGDDPACTVDEFTDVGVAHPFCGEVRWLVGTGVAEGYGDGSYGASAGVARQAMAAFIFRYNIHASLIP